MRRLLVVSGVLAAVIALALWAASSQPSPGTPRLSLDHTRPLPQGDYYVQAVATRPSSLNPFTTTDAVARRSVLSYTHDALFKIDPDTGEVIPSLARVVERSEDGRTFDLEVRSDVRFSDGTPLTMADVLFTFELARGAVDLPGSLWSDLNQLESVSQTGEWRLRLELRERHFAALGLVGTAFVVAQRDFFVREVARLDDGVAAPAGPGAAGFGRLLLRVAASGPGTGPYMLAVDERTGESLWPASADLLLVQNPWSWRRSAHPEFFNLAGMKLVFVSDPVEHRALLREQAVDWSSEDDASEVLRTNPDLAAHYRALDYGYLNLGPVFVVWNHDALPAALGRAEVRRALGSCFDRERVARAVGVRATPAATWFLPGSDRAGSMAPAGFDPEAARATLTAAGIDAPLEIPILTIAHPEFERIVDFAIPDFARAGVALRKEIVDASVLGQRLEQRDFVAAVYAWNPDVFNDPTEIFHSSEAKHNWMGYRSRDMDAVLERARREFDRDRRVEHYHEFNRLLARDEPISLLYHRRISALLHVRFRDVAIGPMGLSPRRWWVEPSEQQHRWGMR